MHYKPTCVLETIGVYCKPSGVCCKLTLLDCNPTGLCCNLLVCITNLLLWIVSPLMCVAFLLVCAVCVRLSFPYHCFQFLNPVYSTLVCFVWSVMVDLLLFTTSACVFTLGMDPLRDLWIRPNKETLLMCSTRLSFLFIIGSISDVLSEM